MVEIPVEEGEAKKTMCATWKEIPCTQWQLMMKDSMTTMKNLDMIANLWKIWHDRDKNRNKWGTFGSYRKQFEFGKELEHEEEDTSHGSS